MEAYPLLKDIILQKILTHKFFKYSLVLSDFIRTTTTMKPAINNPNPESPNQTPLLRKTKQWVTIIIGISILIFGLVLIALPGPAIIIIPLGLAILATELVWARKLLCKVKEKVNGLKQEPKK